MRVYAREWKPDGHVMRPYVAGDKAGHVGALPARWAGPSGSDGGSRKAVSQGSWGVLVALKQESYQRRF